MFDFIDPNKRIWIYIDYSNIYHAKYTLGWEYDVEWFLSETKKINQVCMVWFYGAYDVTDIRQHNWVKKLQTTYTESKFYFYFKKIEIKWWKHKWNVDTEMWFDIANHKDMWDVLILFSWDWDFLYIIDFLIKNHWKQIVIISTKWHVAKELINFTQNYNVDICRFIDMKKNSLVAKPIKDIIKNTKKWLCIPPELLKYIKNCDKKEIFIFRDWIDWVINNNMKSKIMPNIFNSLTNKNNYLTKNTILSWNIEEKKLLLDYLNNMLQ